MQKMAALFKLTRSFSQCRNGTQTVNQFYGCNAARMFSQDSTDSKEATSSKTSDSEVAKKPQVVEKFKTDEEILQEQLKTAKPYSAMPKVPFIPFFGSAWAYFPIIGLYSSKRIHEADIIKNRKYGDVVRERLGNLELVSSFDPVTMLTLKAFEGAYPSRAEFSTIKTYREKRSHWFKPLGLIVMGGREWREFRNRVQKYVLNPLSMISYLDSMQNVSRDFVSLIRMKLNDKREVDDTMECLQKWALESIAYVSLDTRLGCLDPNLSSDSDGMKMIKAVTTQLECINVMEASSGNFPFWKYFSTPTWRRFEKAGDEFTLLAFTYIQYALNNYQQSKDIEPKTILLRMLVKEKLDIPSTMVAVSDLMMAGIDTTSHTAAFLLYNLAKNPEKQRRAYEEIMRSLPNKEDKITKKILVRNLGYLRCCLNESMRLNPVVRGNLRILERDVVVAGYRVPAGTAIISVLQIVYRNEKYFKYANEFIPERWGVDSDYIEPMGYDSFKPFGNGKRSCIGRFTAEQEILTLIVEVLRNFSLEYHYEDMGMYSRLINVPDKPMRIRYLER